MILFLEMLGRGTGGNLTLNERAIDIRMLNVNLEQVFFYS